MIFEKKKYDQYFQNSGIANMCNKKLFSLKIIVGISPNASTS